NSSSGSLGMIIQLSPSSSTSAAALASLVAALNALPFRPSMAMTRIPIDLRIENGGRIPATSAGDATKFAFAGTSPGIGIFTSWLDDTYVNIPTPPASQTYEFQIRIDNLPESYRVQSMTYGSDDLAKTNLKLTASA